MADTSKIFISLANLDAFQKLNKAYIDAGDAGVKSAIEAIIGTPTEGKTIVQMINDAQQAATYDDTQVKSDIKALQDLCGELPETATETDIVSYFTNLVKKAQDAADQAQSEVDDLETLVGVIPVGATATTVTGYAKELADAASGEASQVASDLAAEETRAKAAEKANADAIAKLNDADTVEGSVAYAVKIAKDALDEKIGTVPTKVGETDTKDVVSYVDAKVAEASGDASKVADDLADYIESNDAAVAAVKKTAEDEVTRATGAEEALGGRIDDVEELIGDIEEGSTVAAEIAKAEQNAKDYADGIVSDLGSVLNFKGIVDTEDDLPTDAKQGDVYNVKTTSRGTSAEFVYITDKGWEELGDVLDLSAYDTAEVAAGKIATAKSEAIQAAKDYADGLDSAMDTRVDALEAAIGEGGSVQAQIDASIAELDADEVGGTGKYIKTVKEVDGVITATTGDTSEFATAAQGALADSAVQPEDIVYATDTQITALFADEEVTE